MNRGINAPCGIRCPQQGSFPCAAQRPVRTPEVECLLGVLRVLAGVLRSKVVPDDSFIVVDAGKPFVAPRTRRCSQPSPGTRLSETLPSPCSCIADSTGSGPTSRELRQWNR